MRIYHNPCIPLDITLTRMLNSCLEVSVVSSYVTRDDLGQYHAQLFNGAGYEIGISFVDAETFSWFAIGLPQVMSADSATDSFRYSLGLSMKLMGNFGVGAIYDLIKTGEGTDSGLFTGYSDKENLSFLFTFTLPLGGGGIVNAYR